VGYPNGFDAGDLTPIPRLTMAESVVNYLSRRHPREDAHLERAASTPPGARRSCVNLFNHRRATRECRHRVQELIYTKGAYAYGGYPDIDDLFLQQARERDVRKREAVLFKIQQLTIDRAMFVRSWTFALWGSGRASPSTRSRRSTIPRSRRTRHADQGLERRTSPWPDDRSTNLPEGAGQAAASPPEHRHPARARGRQGRDRLVRRGRAVGHRDAVRLALDPGRESPLGMRVRPAHHA